MSILSRASLGLLPLVVVTGPAGAQPRADPATHRLVDRAVTHRSAALADQRVARWSARARGTVLFLSQVGGDATRSRLVKADQLVVEVYWEAPGRSKQEIVAWRDQTWLPTDIRYHRDHLGIVTNDFGPLIRIGEGDEVRDVPHPLSPNGRGKYSFTLTDSITVRTADRTVRVHAIDVRPLDASEPAVVGTLYLDVVTAALVRFRFSFTRAAYLEEALEDITVVLDNALHVQGLWLPWRQEIEIRRRAGVLDFPARGIIRARWELEDMDIGADASPLSLLGPAIGGLYAPGGPARYWDGPLTEDVLPDIAAATRGDLEAVRQEIREALGRRLIPQGPPARLAAGRLSDLVRVNRVEGVRVGLGATVRPRGIPGAVLEGWAAYSSGRSRASGRLGVSVPVARGLLLGGRAVSEVVDVAGAPPISPMLNSLLAQELGTDRGDWLERRAIEATAHVQWIPAHRASLTASLIRSETLAIVSEPTQGAYRSNPPLGSSGTYRMLRLAVAGRRGNAAGSHADWGVGVEGASGNSEYLRADVDGVAEMRMGAWEAALEIEGVWGTAGLPSARAFVVGGWGTLPGTPYRAFGGRWGALARLSVLRPVGVPELRLGSLMGTGASWYLGPLLAAGVAGGGDPATWPWTASPGIRPVVGVAAEGFWRLLRVEVGRSIRGGGWGASLDITKAWWSIL